MQITEVSPSASLFHSTITIDWTKMGEQTSEEGLIDWVAASPTRENMHVILPSLKIASVRLQRTLQGLGCTVTRRVAM